MKYYFVIFDFICSRTLISSFSRCCSLGFLSVIVVDKAPPNQVPVVFDMLNELGELPELEDQEAHEHNGQQRERIHPSLDVDDEEGVRQDEGDEPVGDHVGDRQGQPQPRHARDNKLLYYIMQTKISDPVHVKLLNG